jgi:hypothetical protein
MKNLKSLLLAFFLFTIFTFHTSAQNNQEQQVAPTFETDLLNLKKEVVDLGNQIIELNNEIQAIIKKDNVKELEIKEYVQEKYLNWWASNFLTILAIAGALGSIIGFFGMRYSVSKKIDEKVKTEIEIHLKSAEWTNALKAKISKQIAENKFKEVLKICILSNDDKTETIIRNYFSENNFPKGNLEYKRISDLDLLKMENYDLIFINNKDNSFNMATKSLDPLIGNIKSINQKMAVFYFNDNGIPLPRELDNGLNSSYSNSLASMYHNLLDLMRYKYLVLDEKNL